MNANNLYLEYARVIKMCKGTELEDRPWECVKLDGKKDFYLGHPDFTRDYMTREFAVAIMEGRPVFVGDEFYNQHGVKLKLISQSWDFSGCTWTKPTPKRTFELNGEVLPCPIKERRATRDAISMLGDVFFFENSKDYEIWKRYFRKLLCEARDKS